MRKYHVDPLEMLAEASKSAGSFGDFRFSLYCFRVIPETVNSLVKLFVDGKISVDEEIAQTLQEIADAGSYLKWYEKQRKEEEEPKF